MPPPSPGPNAGRPARWVLPAVAGLTLLAAGLRFWQLGSLPPGFHVDEAFNVLDARAVLAGWRPVFLPDNAGREVLYTYLQATLMGLLGDRLAVARAASALVGTLTVPAAAWLAWVLADWADPRRRGRLAVWTAAFTALSYWHLHFSRFGIRAVLFPLAVALVLGLWWRSTGPGRSGGGAAASRDASASPVAGANTAATASAASTAPGGDLAIARTRGDKVRLAALALVLGLAVYAHPAGRALALVPAVDAAWAWWRGDRRPMRVLVVALAGAVLVALPVTVFWVQHPWLFTGHAEEVSLAAMAARDYGGNVAAALLYNAAAVLGMFHLAGDPSPWRNLPGRPVFDLLTGLLFLAGLALALRALRRGARWPLAPLAALGILLAPALLSDAAPSFSRAIGILPVVFLFPALALEEVLARVEGHGRRAMRVLAVAGGIAIVTLYGALTFRDYFVVWAADPATPLAFDADKVAIAEAVRRGTAAGGPPYLTFEGASHATVRAITRDAARGFDAGRGLVLPPAGVPEAVYAFRLPEEAAARAAAEAWLAPLGYRVRETTLGLPDSCPPNADCAPAELALLHVPNAALRTALVASPDGAPDLARFGPFIRLREARFPERVLPGTTITITLVWQAIQPADRYLNTLIHLDGADPNGQPVGVGNADGPPLLRREAGASSYPTDRWQPGETILALYPMSIAPDAPPGPADLLVGWYDPFDSRQRLQVDAAGPDKREDGTVWRVGTVVVGEADGP